MMLGILSTAILSFWKTYHLHKSGPIADQINYSILYKPYRLTTITIFT